MIKVKISTKNQCNFDKFLKKIHLIYEKMLITVVRIFNVLFEFEYDGN